jgi:hypothetical protein
MMMAIRISNDDNDDNDVNDDDVNNDNDNDDNDDNDNDDNDDNDVLPGQLKVANVSNLVPGGILFLNPFDSSYI